MRRQKFLHIRRRDKADLNQVCKTEHSKHELNQVYKSCLGSILIILSGILLYADKFFVHYNIVIDNLYGWPDTETFVWTVCQTISPLLILFAAYLRPYLFSVVVPVFCYGLQLGYIFSEDMYLDNHWTWIYLLGSSTLVIVTIGVIRTRLENLAYLKNIEYYNLLDENQQLKAELEKAKRRAA